MSSGGTLQPCAIKLETLIVPNQYTVSAISSWWDTRTYRQALVTLQVGTLTDGANEARALLQYAANGLGAGAGNLHESGLGHPGGTPILENYSLRSSMNDDNRIFSWLLELRDLPGPFFRLIAQSIGMFHASAQVLFLDRVRQLDEKGNLDSDPNEPRQHPTRHFTASSLESDPDVFAPPYPL